MNWNKVLMYVSVLMLAVIIWLILLVMLADTVAFWISVLV